MALRRRCARRVVLLSMDGSFRHLPNRDAIQIVRNGTEASLRTLGSLVTDTFFGHDSMDF